MPDASLTIEEVRHLAALARVGMTEEELETMRDQMSNILENFDVLSQGRHRIGRAYRPLGGGDVCHARRRRALVDRDRLTRPGGKGPDQAPAGLGSAAPRPARSAQG